LVGNTLPIEFGADEEDFEAAGGDGEDEWGGEKE